MSNAETPLLLSALISSIGALEKKLKVTSREVSTCEHAVKVTATKRIAVKPVFILKESKSLPASHVP
jgi:hypothetical protein